jgi:hypothetical protein
MRHIVQVSSIVLSWPQACACCGEAPETHLRASSTTTTTWWEVPYCSRCSRHVSRHRLAKKLAAAGLAGAGLLTVLMITTIRNSTTATLLILGVAVAVLLLRLGIGRMIESSARNMMVPACAASGLAVEYKGWNGASHELVFTSKPYVQAFMAANPSKAKPHVRKVEMFQESA